MSTNRKEFVDSLKIDNRRKIKNQPSRTKYTSSKNMGRKIATLAALAATGLIVLSNLTACKNNDNIKVNSNVNSEPYTITYSTTVTQKQDLETLVKNAQQDFINNFIEAYNQKNGTEYKGYESELCINSINEGIVYKVDDKLVTPGRNPNLVKQKLSKYGTVTIEDGHEKVMQILVNTDEGSKVFTYDAKTLESMYSGNQLENIEMEIPTLEELGISKEVAKSMAELSLAKGVEDEKSIKMRLDKYNNLMENKEVER